MSSSAELFPVNYSNHSRRMSKWEALYEDSNTLSFTKRIDSSIGNSINKSKPQKSPSKPTESVSPGNKGANLSNDPGRSSDGKNPPTASNENKGTEDPSPGTPNMAAGSKSGKARNGKFPIVSASKAEQPQPALSTSTEASESKVAKTGEERMLETKAGLEKALLDVDAAKADRDQLRTKD